MILFARNALRDWIGGPPRQVQSGRGQQTHHEDCAEPRAMAFDKIGEAKARRHSPGERLEDGVKPLVILLTRATAPVTCEKVRPAG